MENLASTRLHTRTRQMEGGRGTGVGGDKMEAYAEKEQMLT